MDTSVIVAAFYSKNGASNKILNYCLQGKIPFALSPLVLMEYYGVLNEKISDGMIRLTINECVSILQALMNRSNFINDPILNRPILPDASDDKILECAISAGAETILTFNSRDFSNTILSEYPIQAIQPNKFLKRKEIR